MRKKDNSLSYVWTTLSILILAVIGIIYISTLSYKQRKQILNLEAQKEKLIIELDEEQRRQTEIENLRAYVKTDAYTEEAARSRFNLVKENETVFNEVRDD